jgi:hypothetical protein
MEWLVRGSRATRATADIGADFTRVDVCLSYKKCRILMRFPWFGPLFARCLLTIQCCPANRRFVALILLNSLVDKYIIAALCMHAFQKTL